MKTPNVQHIVDDVLDRFPGTSVGAWACRRIAGTLTWSQHSWTDGKYEGNAADIFAWRNGRPNMALLDAVYGYLESTYPKTTAHTLWRVKNHYDHVHFDTWPQGFGKPPCGGGTLRVVNRDGSFSKHFYYQIEDDMPLTDEDKAWIRATIVEVLGGDRITMPKVATGEGVRYGNQGVVNSVWHATISGQKAATVLDKVPQDVWALEPGGDAADSAWQNVYRTKQDTTKILKELE